MGYPYRKEFKKFELLTIPTDPGLLKIVNALMPVVQKGANLYPGEIETRKIKFKNFTAKLSKPKGRENLPCLVYYHGGAFLMKEAKYQKDYVQEYVMLGNCEVLDVDYRLAPEHKYPAQLEDGVMAYKWALKHGYEKIALAGDSAGAAIVLAVARYILDHNMPRPCYEMLVYPVADSRMITESMEKYTDTPLWNSTLNPKAWELATNEEDRHSPYVSALEADSFKGFPKTYIETAEFDCLHDDGTRLYKRLQDDGVDVTIFETKGTIHGYDICEHSEYVKDCVLKRIEYLYDALHN